MTRDLSEAVATAMSDRGAGIVFGVPGGGSNLDLVAACEKQGLRFALMHGETAACIAAATYGHLVGAPALALATRGPGAASAVNGAAQATLDRFPLVLATDTVAAKDAPRVSHQRVDQPAMLAPVTKWAGTLGHADPDAVAAAAVELAGSGPQGAVHLDIDGTTEGDAPPARPAAPPEVADASLRAAVELLSSARRPLVIVGLAANRDHEAVRGLVVPLGWPVLCTYQASGVVPAAWPQSAGLFTNASIERPLVAEADVILAIGLDPVEPLPGPWPSAAPIVSASPWAIADSCYDATVELTGALAPLLAALAEGLAVVPALADAEESLQRAGALRLAVAAALTGSDDGFGPVELVRTVQRCAPDDVLVTVDAGAHFLVAMPGWPAAEPSSVLISNGLATMGFAVPAAIAAGLALPGRPVLVLTGDGGLGMALAEIETIVRLDLPVTIVVFNDAELSLIALKQRPGGASDAAIRYGRSDFALVAQGLGMAASVATSAAELERELAGGWDRPRLVDARIDPADYRRVFAALRG